MSFLTKARPPLAFPVHQLGTCGPTHVVTLAVRTDSYPIIDALIIACKNYALRISRCNDSACQWQEFTVGQNLTVKCCYEMNGQSQR